MSDTSKCAQGWAFRSTDTNPDAQTQRAWADAHTICCIIQTYCGFGEVAAKKFCPSVSNISCVPLCIFVTPQTPKTNKPRRDDFAADSTGWLIMKERSLKSFSSVTPPPLRFQKRDGRQAGVLRLLSSSSSYIVAANWHFAESWLLMIMWL